MSKILLIAADHAGVELKAVLKAEAAAAGWQVVDLGTDSLERVDYPVFADKLCAALLAGQGRFGVLICGSGIGMSIAANRFKGIRAALCHDDTTARLARQHNDANVLCLGARTLSLETARDCLRTFLEAGFEGGRHQQRVELLG
jgi:ribose 5-phosphate isomerase B